jgi:hypothetical protein
VNTEKNELEMKPVISDYSFDPTYKGVFDTRLLGKTLWNQFNVWLKRGKLGKLLISSWVIYPLYGG